MRRSLPFAGFLLLAACAPEFDAELGATGDYEAVASARDVVVTADPDAWSGPLAEPGDGVLPVLVTVSNRSPRPVRIAYDNFTLLPHPIGAEYAVLPTDEGGPLIGDQPDAAYGVIPPARVDRPDDEIRRLALPPGVLEPGEGAVGFLYFQEPIEPGPTMDLQVLIEDAETGAVLGTVILPVPPPDSPLAEAPLPR